MNHPRFRSFPNEMRRSPGFHRHKPVMGRGGAGRVLPANETDGGGVITIGDLVASRGGMFAVAYRVLRDPEAAEDVVQDAQLAVHLASARFRHDSNPATYLVRAAFTKAIDAFRHRRRVRPDDRTRDLSRAPTAASPWGTPTYADPERLLYAREVREAIAEALLTLAARQRQAFVMYEVDGYGYDEIAAVFGCAEVTMRVTVHRARFALRERLTEMGVAA